MKEKIRVIVAYCSEQFKNGVLPSIALHAGEQNLTEFEFECENVGFQEDKWGDFKKSLRDSNNFTHIIVEHALRGFMTPNHYKTIDMYRGNMGAELKLFRLKNRKKKTFEEIDSEIKSFFVSKTKARAETAIPFGNGGADEIDVDD